MKYNYLLQIFDDSSLMEEIELLEPTIPISKINPNCYYRIWKVIHKDNGKIWEYGDWAGEIRFSNE